MIHWPSVLVGLVGVTVFLFLFPTPKGCGCEQRKQGLTDWGERLFGDGDDAA